ncbi:hypothetical protein [Streptomyces flaveus]|uniref:Uncharacterized protein n=1 Tax=Streptomyces flaveus TaxID=66370 RepID=A0A917VNR2_9ACTN|nr:hypothetical protein [Streptomyces flaveus]GGL03535.1 hypothetical protein GCM10010094_75520 [Streptomyces flaveus]
MFRHLTPDERRALTARLADQGVTAEQFAQAQKQARASGEALARAYGETLGRAVTPVRFITDVLGVEGAGRLLVCALREVTGRPDLYRDI